jgi:hypothetical protein
MEKKVAKQNMVVIRAYLSGVWHGVLVRKTDKEVFLTNARRLWSWTGALSVSEIAIKGVTGGKISPPTRVTLLRSDCVEIHETDRNLDF